jgi:hypothetical protein
VKFIGSALLLHQLSTNSGSTGAAYMLFLLSNFTNDQAEPGSHNGGDSVAEAFCVSPHLLAVRPENFEAVCREEELCLEWSTHNYPIADRCKFWPLSSHPSIYSLHGLAEALE